MITYHVVFLISIRNVDSISARDLVANRVQAVSTRKWGLLSVRGFKEKSGGETIFYYKFRRII
jgi:hypothetical protein